MSTNAPKIEPIIAPTTTPVFGVSGLVAAGISAPEAAETVGFEAGAVEGVRPIVVVYVVDSRVIDRITSTAEAPFCLASKRG